jgi:hypothetical protein
LHPGQDIKVPVRIPGTEPWFSAGRFPVNISYKWFKGAEMLPIEGGRTPLPLAVRPKQAVNVDVRMIAPNEPGSADHTGARSRSLVHDEKQYVFRTASSSPVNVCVMLPLATSWRKIRCF